jgi:hypothetical protein
MFGAATYFIFTYVLTCSAYITHLGLASCMLGSDAVYTVICISKLHDPMHSLLWTAMYLCIESWLYDMKYLPLTLCIRHSSDTSKEHQTYTIYLQYFPGTLNTYYILVSQKHSIYATFVQCCTSTHISNIFVIPPRNTKYFLHLCDTSPKHKTRKSTFCAILPQNTKHVRAHFARYFPKTRNT